MTCPTCGSDHLQARPRPGGPYPLGIVAIFGLPFAVVHQISAARKYRGVGCGRDFATRTVAARIARVLVFVFGAAFALFIVLLITLPLFRHLMP